MHKNKVTGLTEYETFEELLNADIIDFTEDKKKCYITIPTRQSNLVNKLKRRIQFVILSGHACPPKNLKVQSYQD